MYSFEGRLRVKVFVKGRENVLRKGEMREVWRYNRTRIGKNACDVKEEARLKECVERGVNVT
jgi:hypothetical protein